MVLVCYVYGGMLQASSLSGIVVNCMGLSLSKIDNLVQIAHNCVMGRSCIMAGNSGLAGSVTLGDGVVIGGSASIKDHLTLHSGVVVGAGSGVMRDVPAGKTVLGYPAADAQEKLKEWVATRKLGKQ